MKEEEGRSRRRRNKKEEKEKREEEDEITITIREIKTSAKQKGLIKEDGFYSAFSPEGSGFCPPAFACPFLFLTQKKEYEEEQDEEEQRHEEGKKKN